MGEWNTQATRDYQPAQPRRRTFAFDRRHDGLESAIGGDGRPSRATLAECKATARYL
jgi:hypothetical protein